MVNLNENSIEKSIWTGVKEGDQACFNQLFKKYYSELFYYGIKIFPDSDLVKECIQEVFIRVWETRKRLGAVRHVKSYLIVSLRRLILIQKGKQNLTSELSQVEQSSFHFELNEFEKHQEIPHAVREALLDAINSLTNKQRELITLFFYHDLSYAEIAEVTEISVPSVRNLMYRTLIQLRKTLGETNLESMKNLYFFVISSISSKKM